MARLFPLAILLVTGCSAGTVAPASLPLDADSADRVVIELPDLTSRRVAVGAPESAPLERDSAAPRDAIADEPLVGSSPVVEFGLRYLLISARSRRRGLRVIEAPVRSRVRRGVAASGTTWGSRRASIPTGRFVQFCWRAFRQLWTVSV